MNKYVLIAVVVVIVLLLMRKGKTSSTPTPPTPGGFINNFANTPPQYVNPNNYNHVGPAIIAAQTGSVVGSPAVSPPNVYLNTNPTVG